MAIPSAKDIEAGKVNSLKSAAAGGGAARRASGRQFAGDYRNRHEVKPLRPAPWECNVII